MAADNVATFEVVLDSRQLVLGAEDGAKALDKLGQQIGDDTAEIQRMEKAMKALQKGGFVNLETWKKMKNELKAKKEAVALNTNAYIRFGGKLSEIGKTQSPWKKLLAEAQKMPGPIGAATNAFQRLSAAVGGGGRATLILGVAAAFAAVTAAVVKQTAALYRYGVAQAEAIRNEKIMLGNLVTVRNYWGIAAGNAEDLSSAIDRVSGASTLSRERLTEMARGLYVAGVRGQNLTDTLQGFATTTEVQGDEQAQLWLGYAKAVALGGGSVKKMADTVQAQLGGRVQEMMLSSEVQAQKLAENYRALFGNLKLAPLLKAKASFYEMFSQGNAFGRALKALLGTVLQPLVDAQAKAWPVIKRFFQGMLLSALDFGIVVLDIAIWVKETFGLKAPGDLKKTEGAFAMLGRIAFYVLGVIVGLTAVLAIGLATSLTAKVVPALWSGTRAMTAFGLSGLKALGRLALGFSGLAVKVLAATWPILLAAAALWGLYKIGELLYVIWDEIGREMWRGFVRGIESGWDAISKALSELADKAKTALKSALGIASPSKVFAELGEDITGGLVVGMEAGKADVDQTVRHLVEPADAKGAGPAAANGSAGKSIVFSFGDININGAAGDSPQKMAASIMDELEKRLTEASLELGVAV